MGSFPLFFFLPPFHHSSSRNGHLDGERAPGELNAQPGLDPGSPVRQGAPGTLAQAPPGLPTDPRLPPDSRPSSGTPDSRTPDSRLTLDSRLPRDSGLRTPDSRPAPDPRLPTPDLLRDSRLPPRPPDSRPPPGLQTPARTRTRDSRPPAGLRAPAADPRLGGKTVYYYFIFFVKKKLEKTRATTRHRGAWGDLRPI